MYKKIVTSTLLAVTFFVSVNVSFAARAVSGDDIQPVAKRNEPKPETLREAFAKKSETKAVPVEAKGTMADYEKEKAVGKKLSKQSKVLIGVGIGAAIAVAIVIGTYFSNER